MYASPKGFALVPLDQWLVAYCALTGRHEPTKTLHNYILRSIAGECGFALIHQDGELVSCGLAVIEAELVGFFDISLPSHGVTRPQRRNRGFAPEVVKGLLSWAYQRGARRSYLQVVSDNKAALHMYNKLGFREIYHYWYRIGAQKEY